MGQQDLRIVIFDIADVALGEVVDRDLDGRARLTIEGPDTIVQFVGGDSRADNIAGARRLVDQLFLYIQVETHQRLADEARGAFDSSR